MQSKCLTSSACQSAVGTPNACRPNDEKDRVVSRSRSRRMPQAHASGRSTLRPSKVRPPAVLQVTSKVLSSAGQQPSQRDTTHMRSSWRAGLLDLN